MNFAFLGQFAETPRDTIFTTEYSMRTGMEAVYTLLNVDRGVPEVWGSVYDVRDLLNATVKLRDGKKATDMELGLDGKAGRQEAAGQDRKHRYRKAPEGIPRHLTAPSITPQKRKTGSRRSFFFILMHRWGRTAAGETQFSRFLAVHAIPVTDSTAVTA